MNEYYYEADNSKGYFKAETDQAAIREVRMCRTVVVKRKENSEWKIIHKHKGKS